MNTQAMMVLLSFAFSPKMTVVRFALMVLSLLFITGVINMNAIIDSAMFGFNEEYLVPMLIAGIITSFIACYVWRLKFHEEAADNKVAKGEIATTNDLPFDKRYDAMTALSFVAAVFVGLWCTPGVVNNGFINAGAGTFVAMTVILTAVAATIAMFLTHCGVRLTLVRFKDYVFGVMDTVQDVVDEVKDKLDDGEVNGSVAGGTEVVDTVKDAISGVAPAVQAVENTNPEVTTIPVKVRKG